VSAIERKPVWIGEENQKRPKKILTADETNATNLNPADRMSKTHLIADYAKAAEIVSKNI
jgi:hypothetical protein